MTTTPAADDLATVLRLLPDQRVLRLIEVRGTVQGVGFRPFAHRLATALGLDGWVRNENGHVVSLVSGPRHAVVEYALRLDRDAPAPAAVADVRCTRLAEEAGAVADHPELGAAPVAGAGFRVLPSPERRAAGGLPEIAPDAATCPDCLRELFDPADRRHRYPFLTCAACGPRATVIDDLPYDRERTAMRAFPLCAACAAEYADAADRRFHAESVACPACGPRLAWHTENGDQADGEEALAAAEEAIRSGGIVAVKGLGGYQLLCNAMNERAVRRLRERKHRPRKPLAVMVRDLDAVGGLTARLPAAATGLLTGPARPIVLLPARPGTGLAPAVHPGSSRVGLFLPTTPLHHLLLHDLDRPLVVTSGNRSEEPIAIDDTDAFDRLAGVADGFLTHDRPVLARYDDSVVHLPDGVPAVIRRARGHAPASLPLPVPAPEPVLAVGAHLKHTFALATGGSAVLGPHTGDLGDADTLAVFDHSRARLGRLLDCTPRWVAHDPHPGYLSTAVAARWPAGRRIPVQHHHAHVAACAAEHGVTGTFVGVAYDGLGLGDDGTLWGGEVLVADLLGYRRFGRFAYAPLPGGEAAVRHPARMALGYLHGLEPLGGPRPEGRRALDLAARMAPREHRTVLRMIAQRVNAPAASSAGRLFDAVAALLGLCDEVSYEGEAAVLLEEAAGSATAEPLPWRLLPAGGHLAYDPALTLAALLDSNAPAGVLAAAFHTTVVEVTAALATEAAHASGADTVCLSGGCFANHRLLTGVQDRLAARGLRVLIPRTVPCGDGGISYGQAAVAAARLAARAAGKE